MTESAYGPVPMSRLNAESAEIFAALESGRQVAISRHGQVVAILDPARAGYEAAIQAYSLPGEAPFDTLRISEFSKGKPSRYVTRAAQGHPAYVVKGEKVFGILRAPDDEPSDTLTVQEARRRQAILEQFMVEHPNASAEDLIAATDRATEQVRAERSEVASAGVDALWGRLAELQMGLDAMAHVQPAGSRFTIHAGVARHAIESMQTFLIEENSIWLSGSTDDEGAQSAAVRRTREAGRVEVH